MTTLDDIMGANPRLTERERQILNDLAISLAGSEGEMQAVYIESNLAMAMALVILTGLEVLDNDEDDTLPRV